MSQDVDWPALMNDQYPRACAVVARLMPATLKAQYDPEDFVNAAIVELLADPTLMRQHGPDFLILIAKRRMIDTARSPRSRFKPLDTYELAASLPSAESAFDAAELRESLLDRAGEGRVIIELREAGHQLPEIAGILGKGTRTLQRWFRLFVQINEPY